MATDPNDPLQEALFREVEEDLRHERLTALWKKHGGLVIGAAVALVLLVGGYEGWRAWTAKQRVEESLRYAAAIQQVEDGKTAEALESLAVASARGESGYRAIAALRRAGLLASQGDGAGAAALYRKIADDSAAEEVHRNAALLLAVMHSVDQGDPKALEASLEPLAAPESPWRFSALEIKALLALRQGDAKRANALWAEISDAPDAPSSVRMRAAEMMTGQSAPPSRAGK